MPALQRARKRMPVVAFFLLALICLLMIGIACACATDHPTQNIDRALSVIPTAPPLIEVWSLSFAALLVLVPLATRLRRAGEGRSPAGLQCFLF